MSSGPRKSLHARSLSKRKQINYGFGVELTAHPRATVIVDIVGRRQLHGGKFILHCTASDENGTSETLVGLPEGLDIVSFAPGVKWNVAGNVLLTANVLASLANQGLQDPSRPRRRVRVGVLISTNQPRAAIAGHRLGAPDSGGDGLLCQPRGRIQAGGVGCPGEKDAPRPKRHVVHYAVGGGIRSSGSVAICA